MPRRPLTLSALQRYQKEPRLKGVYTRNNSPKTKDGEYIINLNEYKSIGLHWIDLYVNDVFVLENFVCDILW